MKTETIEGIRLVCYDNGGKSADRYTVVFLDCPEGDDCYTCLGANAYPFHPQGIGMHGTAKLGRHLGKRVPFASLPLDVQTAALLLP